MAEFNSAPERSTVSIELEHVNEYVDKMVTDSMRADLAGINGPMDVIFESLTALRELGNALLTSEEASTGGGGSRNRKLASSMITLADRVGDIKRPGLLDGTFVALLIKDLKRRVKSIEDVTVNSKVGRVVDANGGCVVSQVRSRIFTAMKSIEQLESQLNKQSGVLDFLTTINTEVHARVRKISAELTALSKLEHSTRAPNSPASGGRGSAHDGMERPVRNDSHGILEQAEVAYDGAREAPVLVRVVETRADANMLLEYMNGMLQPIREYLLKYIDGDVSAPITDESLQTLVRVLQLGNSGGGSGGHVDGEGILVNILMNLMINEVTKHEFAEAVRELQAHAQAQALHDTNAAALSPSDADHVRGMQEVDLDMLFAALADWRMCMEQLSADQHSPAFGTAVAELVKSRAALQGAIHHNDLATSTRDTVTAHFGKLKKEMLEVKSYIETLCQSEFGISVCVTLPTSIRRLELPGSPTSASKLAAMSSGGSGKKKNRENRGNQ